MDQMAESRGGERGLIPIRTDRFYVVNDAWFFATRENGAVGPFWQRADAEQELRQFIAESRKETAQTLASIQTRPEND